MARGPWVTRYCHPFTDVGMGRSFPNNTTAQSAPRAGAERESEEGLPKGHRSTLVNGDCDGVTSASMEQLRAGKPVVADLEIVAGVEAHDDGDWFGVPFTLAPGDPPRARSLVAPHCAGEIELPEEANDVLRPPGLPTQTVCRRCMARSQSSRRAERRGRFACAFVSGAADRRWSRQGLTGRGARGAEARSRAGCALDPTDAGGVGKRWCDRWCDRSPRVLRACHLVGLRRSIQRASAGGPRRETFGLDGGLPIPPTRRALAACFAAVGPSDSLTVALPIPAPPAAPFLADAPRAPHGAALQPR